MLLGIVVTEDPYCFQVCVPGPQTQATSFTCTLKPPNFPVLCPFSLVLNGVWRLYHPVLFPPFFVIQSSRHRVYVAFDPSYSGFLIPFTRFPVSRLRQPRFEDDSIGPFLAGSWRIPARFSSFGLRLPGMRLGP